MSERTNRRSFSSIRVRLTLISIVAIAVVLVVVAVGIVYWQNRSIVQAEQSRISNEAASVALDVSQGKPIRPSILPGTGIQVVSEQGQILNATESLFKGPPVSEVKPPVGTPQSVPLAPAYSKSDDGIGVVEATSVTTSTGTVTVYAVAYGTQIESSNRSLIIGFAFILPNVLLVLGTLIWIMTGLALRPVERMRMKVDTMAEDELDQRVPVPPGKDEIARLASTLNEMLNRLESAQIRQRGFVSDASHELRSPITSLLVTVEVAQAHPEKANWPEVANVFHAECERLSRLVDDLLLLAANDERQRTRTRLPVDIDELLFAEADRLRVQGSLRVDTSGVSAARILGDPIEISRVIRNIVDNAVRHASASIRFSVEIDGNFAKIFIADDGPGVNQEDAERLFERFVRSDQARDRPTGGAGLGLAIVAEIVANHGGSVRFVPVVRGATVELVLPLFG